MAYFKIGENDYSLYCNHLKVTKTASYRAQTNAAGNTVVDNANSKRIIEVGIIPLNDTVMKKLLTDVDNLEVYVSFRNPITNELAENVHCIIPTTAPEYYTIQVNKVMYKAFTLTFTEL